MFKKIVAIAALTMCSAAGAAPILLTNSAAPVLSGATQLDFNAEATGTFLSRSFGDGDVTINASAPSLSIRSTYSGSYAMSGRYVENPGGRAFDLVFADAVSAFGFNWGAADQAWTMKLFGANDVQIGSLAIAAQTSPHAGFIGADGGGALIKRVLMSSASNDYVMLDNLKYVTAASAEVPEPASLALLGLGLFGLIAARRRKH